MNAAIGILALQGGFASHRAILEKIGADTLEVRTAADLERCDALVIPGGESTVLTRLLRGYEETPELQNDSRSCDGGKSETWSGRRAGAHAGLEPGGLRLAMRAFIESGKPVMGTCAGLILLARPCGDERVESFDALPVSVERNAYGRQSESFVEPILLDLPTPAEQISAEQNSGEQGRLDQLQREPFPATFIRAPRITAVGEGVEVLARSHWGRGAQAGGDPVFVRFRNILGLTFHPELNPEDSRIHRYFLDMSRAAR